MLLATLPGSNLLYSNVTRLVSLAAALHVACHRLVPGSSFCMKASTVMLALSISMVVMVLLFAQLQACMSQATEQCQDLHGLT